MRTAYCVAAAILIMTLGAKAQSADSQDPGLPSYDVDANCDRMPNQNSAASYCLRAKCRGGRYGEEEHKEAKTVCIFNEQKAYDELKLFWNILLPKTRKECISKLSNHGGAWPDIRYAFLNNCVTVLDQYNRDIEQVEEEKQRMQDAQHGFQK
jgi:hypothetical protein